MTAKKDFWLVDETGNKALVQGADDRDRLLPLGWSEATEPTGDEQVWMSHPEVENPARFPAGALAQWQVLGWQPGLPPGDRPAEQVVTAVQPLTTNEAAAGGDTTKEKTRG